MELTHFVKLSDACEMVTEDLCLGLTALHYWISSTYSLPVIWQHCRHLESLSALVT